MKTRFFKTILALTLALIALPMMGQDFMNVYFKDGSHQKFFMPYVKELSSSKYDAEGNLHDDYLFHLVTDFNKYIYDIAEIDSIAFTKSEESVDDSYGECYIDIPVEAGVRLDQLTILDDGSKVEASENGLLGKGLGDVIVFNGDNIVYISYGEETEDRVVNAKETAISLLLNVVPFAVTDLDGDGLWLFKQMIGHLSETRELADAIEQSIIKRGYFDMESIDSQYQAAVGELRSRLGLDDAALSRINEARRTKSTTYPLFLYGGREAKADGFSIIKESSVWGKAEKEEDGYCWKCNFTLLNADRWCYTGVTKMRKNERGTFNRINTSLDGTFRYLVKPMNVSAFMDFGTLSDLATNPKEFLVTLSDPDFERVINQFWEPLKNLGHVIKGEPTETTTFDKIKVEDIKFDLFPDNEHLGVIGPGIDGNLMLFNILKVAFQPIMKLMIKDIKKSDNYKNDHDYGDKLLIEFVKWIAEADLQFREEMLATFTDSSLPWAKRIEIIGEKTFKKFEKFLVEDVALTYVSEKVYKSFFGYLAKGYDDPQVKEIFAIYKTILVAGDILLFAIDADYEGVAFEIDYGPSLENIQAKKETFTVNGVSFDMIYLTGGSFMMGADDDDKKATSDEKPLHAVTLSNFALGETEVTQALWEAVMGSNPSKFKGANRPVDNVAWLDCQEFITKLNGLTGRTFRLPTEAEWEYAATGGLYSRGFLYAGSDDIDKVAWYEDNSGKETHPVKLKQCNEFGFYDMSGNVFEWCQDFYDVDYYDRSPDVDPCNEKTATLYKRVLRGGCWHWGDKYCRVSSRSNNGQGVDSEIFGLRLAMSGSFNPDQEVTQAQYEAAKAGIEVDGTYLIYTQFNGTTEGAKKYYLKDDGHLTESEEEAYVFTFGRVEGSSLFVSPGWKLDIPFSNPHLSNGATGTLPLHGQIRVAWDNKRNDWEGQVWYKNGDYYAVRSTNAVSEQWGASTFWAVLDSDANGMPEADYSLTPKFVWQLEKAEAKENPRDLMLTTESEGTTYSIYRQVIDKKDIHTNPDKWITYRSLLTLDVTKNGATTTYTLDDNIYLEEKFGYNEGQVPCIILNYQTNEIGIFCVSKDAKAGNYTMDGYYYTSPMNSISFQREKVFGNDNWGWYPYFTYEGGQLKLQHFSFNGYYAMTSTRKSVGSWSTSRGSSIRPENFKQNSIQIGHVLIISGGTDPVNTDCPARVVSVDLNSTEYHRISSYPNQMFFSVNAKLDDMTDVTEWGVYFDNRPGKKEFAFESVSAEQTIKLYYNGQEGLLKVDVNSFIAQLDDEVGVYVKKRDKTTGTQKTLYSNLFSFKLLYDKKPSMVISNPVIVKTEITGVSDGKNQYRTDITHDYTLAGAFWISYIDSDVSGNDWTFKNMNTNWYPETDGSGQLNWVATYDDDTNLPHTNWRVLHLRNNKTINSNYVNFSGNKVLTEAWVSDSPVYTARIADRKNSAKGSRGYISLSIPEESSRVSNTQKKQEVPYKGGYLGAY